MPVSSPQVTVLLPVRNGSAHLQASLDSIFAQTLADFELLVIDDGSTDRSPEILRAVRDPRLRVVTNPQNLGLVPSLNRGLELARGEFIARQDHDDISLPPRLQMQVDFLRAHPAHVLVGTEAVQTDARGRRMFRLLRPRETGSIRWYLCFDNAFIHSSVMFRREVVQREFGSYAHSLHSEDYALWSRIARAHDTANLPEPLLLYREHASSVIGSMSAPDTTAFEKATAAIRLENLRMLITGGDSALLAQYAQTFSTYRRDFSIDTAQAFLTDLQALVTLKFGPAPVDETKLPEEYRHVLAMQYAELAYRLLPLARSQALGLYRRALRLSPELAGSIPWLRVAGLFLLGENARNLVRAITG